MAERKKEYQFHKVKLLYVADYIMRNSDEDHGFFIKDIIEYLEDKDIKADYHSISDDIKLLRDGFGMDIDGGGGRGRPFYLLSRFIPFEELSLIAECIGASKFLSEEDSKRLTEKLKKLCSDEQGKIIDNDYYIKDRPRKTQENLLETLVLIRDAIKQNVMISFKYTTRKLRGLSKTYRNKGQTYTVSPFKVVLSDGNHYLIAYNVKDNRIRAYRINRMDSVSYVYKPREGKEAFDRIEIEDYAKQTFGMFIGPKPKKVTLLCDNDLLDTMYERFGNGRDEIYQRVDDNHFSITTKIVVSPIFFGWICGFGGKAIIQDDGEEDGIAKRYADYLEKVKKKQAETVGGQGF